MVLSFLSFIIPMLSTVYLTYTQFYKFYQESPVFLVFLCALGLLTAIFVVAPVKPSGRLFLFATPFLILYCLIYNFTATAILIAATVIPCFFIPRKYVKKRVLFTEENEAVFITYSLKKPLKSIAEKLSGVTFFTSLLLFVATCIFTTPVSVWRTNVFPIDLSEKEIPGEYVAPSGEVTCAVGYDEEAMMINSFIDIQTKDGILPSPAQSAGMKEGDVIVQINSQRAKMSDFLKKGADGSTVTVTVMRLEEDGTTKDYVFDVTPLYSIEEEKYMIGITYYDAYMIGIYSTVQTVSFTYPDTGYFAATAHASDMKLGEGYSNILRSAKVLGRDDSGLLASPGDVLGEIVEANRYGAFGIWEEDSTNLVPIAKKNEIRLGKATVLSDFEGDGVREYEAEVTGTYRIDSRDVICLTVTDPRITEAGGITRGMSGSPVIQNGKIIGALSNTDSKGYCSYATFAYDMAHEIYLVAENIPIESEVE